MHTLKSVRVSEPYPFIVIHQGAPVQHVHHGLKAEDRLVQQLFIACS